MANYILNSFLIACIVWTYQIVLREFLLSKWFLYGYKTFGKDEDSWKYYIYKVVWDCEKCLSGQLALWLFFVVSSDYHLFYHIGFIALTILITRIIFYVENRISNNAQND